jgi:hypothetical protein
MQTGRFTLPEATGSPRGEAGEIYSPIFNRCFAFSIVVIFAVVHSPMNFARIWYDRICTDFYSPGYISAEAYHYAESEKDLFLTHYYVPIRAILFFFSLSCVLYPVIVSIKNRYRQRASVWLHKKNLLTVLLSFVILCVLVFPLNLAYMGRDYAQMSYNPFGYLDLLNWFYQRLLMPSLAYFLQLEGPVLYFVFSLSCTLTLCGLVHLFFLERGIPLTMVELISICTSSFIVSQLYLPGYTEQMAYIFLILLFVVPTGPVSRLSIVVLAMISHEISTVVVVLIAIFYFTREERWNVGAVIVLYAFFWFLSYGLNLANLLAVRNVRGISGIGYLARYPVREILGVAVSMKLLWLVVGIALYKLKAERKVIAGFIAIALFFTVVGVDTSRLMGFGFLGLLLSFYWVKRDSLVRPTWLRYIMIANLLIPSFYIGTLSGLELINGIFNYNGTGSLVIANGLYQIFYLGFLFR